MNEQKEKQTYKITIIGNSNVGKTSLIRRYTKHTFDPNSISTLGFDCNFIEVELKSGEKIDLKIVDTAGQEKYKSLSKSYFRGADGLIIAYAVDDMDSFNDLEGWFQLFFSTNSQNTIPIYLVGTKDDKEKIVPDEKAQEYADKHKLKFFLCSSFYDEPEKNRVEVIFQNISEDIYIIKKGQINKTQKVTKIANLKEENKKKSCQCQLANSGV